MKRLHYLVVIAMLLLGTAAAGPQAASGVSIPAGRVRGAVSKIDGLARQLLRKSGVPGMAVAVVYGDKVLYAKGFGYRNLATRKPVDADTVFQIASLSKSLAATVVAGAVGEGVVKWSDPVAKYLPGFTLSDQWVGRHVTIADMFAHRSGLPDHAGDYLEDLGYTRAEIIRRLRFLPLDPFRITYAYTNFGLTAGAVAAAGAAHTTWEQLAQRILYAPLGMTETSSRYADYVRRSDRAVLYRRIGGKWVAGVRDPDAQSPAGGVSSSVRDMAKWLILELNQGTYRGKRVIDSTALVHTWVPQIVSGPLGSPVSRASFYGLGTGVNYDETGRLRLSHSGAFLMGAATTYDMLPAERLGIVVLTNAQPGGVPDALTKEFFDLVEMGKVQRDWYAGYAKRYAALYVNPSKLAGKNPPARPSPAHRLAAYTGRYDNAYFGAARIEASNGRLTMILGPHRMRFELSHWSGDTFWYVPVGENAVGKSAVTFAVRAGRAASFTVENLNENRLGTFTRG